MTKLLFCSLMQKCSREAAAEHQNKHSYANVLQRISATAAPIVHYNKGSLPLNA
jgi:hypothetical protein